MPTSKPVDPSASVLAAAGDREQHHIEKAEPTLVCQAMESVQVNTNFGRWFGAAIISHLLQGSHVMTHTGHYILQWTCPAHSDQPAQLMHFHEILSSRNYKGSMSSLQSGVSALSLNISMPSR